MIAPVFRPRTDLHLFGAGDVPWIAQLLDLAMAACGEPWRVLIERLDQAALRVAPSQITGITDELRRSDGHGERAQLGRNVRRHLLGNPALDPRQRSQRVTDASMALGVAPPEIERLLWADLALERPVVLPDGRPVERALAARANLDRIQRAVRRAHTLEIHVWDKPDGLVRAAAHRGLLVSVSRAIGGATVLEVIGPLSLRHGSAAYGRELAELLPELAAHERFTLEIRSYLGEHGTRERTIRVASPVLLPSLPRSRPRASRATEWLAKDLVVAGYAVEREPPPLSGIRHLLYPDLAVERSGARGWIEVLGFSTREYLVEKLSHYRAAGLSRIVLCVDEARHEPDTSTSTLPRRGSDSRRQRTSPHIDHGSRSPSAARSEASAIDVQIVPFTRRIDPRAVLALLEAP